MSAAVASGTQVLINKPTIINGAWREIPVIVTMRDGRVVSEKMPLREQLIETGMMLAVMVIVAPGLFIAADWLRYA